MNKLCLIYALLLILFSCKDHPDHVLSNDPHWFKRSSLDQRPAMLTLNLYKDVYAAYDTRKAVLYKVWRGGVNWEGANFNNIKSVQPSSWGSTIYEANPDKVQWYIKNNSGSQKAKPQYESFVANKNQPSLHYSFNNGEISVKEQVSVTSNGDSLHLKRTFDITGGDNIDIFCGDYNLTDEMTIVIPPTLADNRNDSSPDKDIVSEYWLNREGCNTCHEAFQKMTGPSYEDIAKAYSKSEDNLNLLANKIINGGSGVWGETSMAAHPHISNNDAQRMANYILSFSDSEEPLGVTKRSNSIKTKEAKARPGFGEPLKILHPSFDLVDIRPDWFKPRVGGMDFTEDGKLLVSTWDSIGGVYLISGVDSPDLSKIDVKEIAIGLAEPLGLKVVDGDLYVLQKHELTKLVDYDGDDIIDEYVNVCNSFDATFDFHEYSYGLEYKDGWFYANLGIAMRLMSHEKQLDDRGTAIRISKEGDYEIIATGLRQANGIGQMSSGDIFVTENQGQFVPASKLIHLKEGEYHGCQYGTGDKYSGLQSTLPVVWMPQHEIGNSPSQPIEMIHGPYKGNILYGEVTHGGIKRVVLDKVNGAYQGVLFRFSQGLEAGINRMVWGQDNSLYVGGVGMTSNWSWKGKQYGLQKLVHNGEIPFELLSVRLIDDGFELEFTNAPDLSSALNKENYFIEQWRYEITPKYGGDKLDLEELKVKNILATDNPNIIEIKIDGLKPDRVVYILLSDVIKSKLAKPLFTGEAWYTLNSLQTNIVI